MTWVVLTLTLLTGGPHTVTARSNTGSVRATLDGVTCTATVGPDLVALVCDDAGHACMDALEGDTAGCVVSNVEASAERVER